MGKAEDRRRRLLGWLHEGSLVFLPGAQPPPCFFQGKNCLPVTDDSILPVGAVTPAKPAFLRGRFFRGIAPQLPVLRSAMRAHGVFYRQFEAPPPFQREKQRRFGALLRYSYF